jgi:Lrp/AsnC family transcriptional regulator, regulator for asnA, asnC and gidA
MTILDEIDQMIVDILQEDGRAAHSQIAKRIGISEATVRRRLARLEKEDCIRVVAVANPFKLGFNIIAIIGLLVERSRLRDIERVLTSYPEVRFLGVTIGGYDLIFEGWFRSNEELLEFLSETLGHIDGVQRSESFQILRLSKYTYDWGREPSAQFAIQKIVPESV